MTIFAEVTENECIIERHLAARYRKSVYSTLSN